MILEALRHLEYRGYDSAGVAVVDGGAIRVEKAKGKLAVLSGMTDGGRSIRGTVGIGHTRWATHGRPSDVNSHPHLSADGSVAVVHNGIIENYIELGEFLRSKGYTFVSDTDTEVVAQTIDYFYHGDPLSALQETLDKIDGSYAFGIIFRDYPDRIYCAKKDSPLIVGLGKGENFIASDIPALIAHTRDVFRLGEGEYACVTADRVEVYDSFGAPVEHEVMHVDWDPGSAEKGGYPHFMIKEIYEQPDVIRKTVRPRIKNGRVTLGLKNISDDELRSFNKVCIVACGSAYHVGCVAKPIIQRMAHIPVTVELASEFRYNDPPVDEKTLVIMISQSGETLDTKKAQNEAARLGGCTLSVVNVVGSTIASESRDVIYTWAGPEICVATTKAYSAQLAVMYLIAVYMGRVRGALSEEAEAAAVREIEALPELMTETLGLVPQMQQLAAEYFNRDHAFFLGRNIDYSICLEASLKLKEISYIHSEAYAAGELKHGTISLIEPGTLVIAMSTYRPLREKMISNMTEVSSRGAIVIAVTGGDTSSMAQVADHIVRLPDCGDMTRASLAIIPMQLFAYYVASLRGCDIDKPRNLAKSVTVE